jgi:hypothetical protein
MRMISIALGITLVLLLNIFPGCITVAPAEDIGGALTTALAAMTKSTLESYNGQVAQLDAQLAEAQTKLNKLEEVAKPALEWIELTKARATSEGWGGTRTVQVGRDLNLLQNDQYRIAKLELVVSLISAGHKFEPTILIDDLKTAQVTPYEDLRDSFQKQIDTLKKQRQTILQSWDVVKAAGSGAVEQSANWKITKVDSVTYQVSGEGLGWSNGLVRGDWLYNTSTGSPAPSGTAAQALQKVLTGQ